MAKILKIGIIGPESTGKSTLAQQLAIRLNATHVPEYAREYIGSLGRAYTYEDVCHVAEQNRREAMEQESGRFQVSCSKKTVVFFDTELILTKVWLDVVYGRRPEWITSPIPEDCRMDLYLLTRPDIAAEPDPLRENTSDEARERLYNIYLREIQATGRPYAIVSGQGEARIESAMQAIKPLLS